MLPLKWLDENVIDMEVVWNKTQFNIVSVIVSLLALKY